MTSHEQSGGRLEFVSCLLAEPDRVWAAATSLDGINRELRPWLCLSAPPGITDLSSLPAPASSESPLFSATVWFAYVLPVDRMQLRLAALEERRFVERSQLLSMKRWQHERVVRALPGGGSELTDQLALEPRVPGTGPLLRFFVRLLFLHRHRRLRRRHGTPER